MALRLLSRVAFRDGLVAGVPSAIPVSHKFGERGFLNENQFHDCGIVYYPLTPYFICVMVSGKKLEPLIPIIADISRMTFKFITAPIKDGSPRLAKM